MHWRGLSFYCSIQVTFLKSMGPICPLRETLVPSFSPFDPGTMAPDLPWALEPAAGHQGEVLTCPTPTKPGMLFNFAFMKFSQKCMVEAARTSRRTLCPPPALDIGVQGSKCYCDLLPMRVTFLPSFGPIGPGTMAPDLPRAQGPAGGHLSEVLM